LLRAEREKLIRYGAIKGPPKPDSTSQGNAAPQPTALEADNGVLRLPLDASLLLRLHGLSRPIELIDENGKVVARVTPLSQEPPQAPQSPRPGGESPPRG
jgi:hypothetical protein